MLDPRLISSSVQTGRSLAPQGPPIQEMLGMKMQQNQMIAEVMKELLKAHMSDISDLRKMQMNMVYKAWSDPNLDQTERDSIADKILKMDLSRFGGLRSTLKGGFGGEDITKEKGTPMTGGGGIMDMLGGTQNNAPENYYASPVASSRPSPMQNVGGAVGNFAAKTLPQAMGSTLPGKAVVAPFSVIDSFMKGLKRPGTTSAPTGTTVAAPVSSGKDQFGFTLGQLYKGYKYIGNNKWQK